MLHSVPPAVGRREAAPQTAGWHMKVGIERMARAERGQQVQKCAADHAVGRSDNHTALAVPHDTPAVMHMTVLAAAAAAAVDEAGRAAVEEEQKAALLDRVPSADLYLISI